MQSLIALVPSDLVVRRAEPDAYGVVVTAGPRSGTATRPQCHRLSRRVHSRCRRKLADLPWRGRAVIIDVAARQFRCRSANGSRKAFVERMPNVAGLHARRTTRSAEIQRHVGLALGGAAGARLAQRLGLPASGSTLLRLVRRGTRHCPPPQPRVIDIDNWARRHGHRYGSIICDLERRRVVDLLPDRTGGNAAGLAGAHPCIDVIARDRGRANGPAATRARRKAVQVADRWNLMENARAAFLSTVRRSTPRICDALGSAPVGPGLLCASRCRALTYPASLIGAAAKMRAAPFFMPALAHASRQNGWC